MPLSVAVARATSGAAEAAVVAETGWSPSSLVSAALEAGTTSASLATGVVGTLDGADRGGEGEGAGDGDADKPGVAPPAPAPATANEAADGGRR